MNSKVKGCFSESQKEHIMKEMYIPQNKIVLWWEQATFIWRPAEQVPKDLSPKKKSLRISSGSYKIACPPFA